MRLVACLLACLLACCCCNRIIITLDYLFIHKHPILPWKVLRARCARCLRAIQTFPMELCVCSHFHGRLLSLDSSVCLRRLKLRARAESQKSTIPKTTYPRGRVQKRGAPAHKTGAYKPLKQNSPNYGTGRNCQTTMSLTITARTAHQPAAISHMLLATKLARFG